MTDDQWIQASLPVHNVGLGLDSACMLAHSTFSPFAAATLELQNETLSSWIHQLSDHCTGEALGIWFKAVDIPEPVYPADDSQKV